MSLSRGSLPDPDQPALMCGRVTSTRAEPTARGHSRRSRPHDSPDRTGGYAVTEVWHKQKSGSLLRYLKAPVSYVKNEGY
jgi:hypothetical protein